MTVVDGLSFFHQFRVCKEDREKFTIVTHRGLEQSKVALMGYKGSPIYTQRIMDRKLSPFRAFCRAFIDDVIIFSKTLEEHVQHLHQIFSLFTELNIALNPKKSCVGFPSITLLGQHVDSFGMLTTAEKIAALVKIVMLTNLKALDYFVGLSGFLRAYIPLYAQVIDPLTKRKTELIKRVTVAQRKKGSKLTDFEPTDVEQRSFQAIRTYFSEARFLFHQE